MPARIYHPYAKVLAPNERNERNERKSEKNRPFWHFFAIFEAEFLNRIERKDHKDNDFDSLRPIEFFTGGNGVNGVFSASLLTLFAPVQTQSIQFNREWTPIDPNADRSQRMD